MGISEDILKEHILARYKSIREFTSVIDMPYSTIDSIFKRGIHNTTVSNIYKICEFLEINMDALVSGRIEHATFDSSIIINNTEYTKEELDEIRNFAEFVKNRRK